VEEGTDGEKEYMVREWVGGRKGGKNEGWRVSPLLKNEILKFEILVSPLLIFLAPTAIYFPNAAASAAVPQLCPLVIMYTLSKKYSLM